MTEQLTTWARIEPHAATTDIDVGLAAEVADPMWFLARQLQLGEFTGDDGGSPVDIELRASWAPLARYRPGLLSDAPSAAVDYDPNTMPLEPLIEAEPLAIERAWELAAKGGLRLERELLANGLAAAVPLLRDRFPFPPKNDRDQNTGTHELRYAAIFKNAINGISANAEKNAALADIRAASGNPDKFNEVFKAWRKWMNDELGIPSDDAQGNTWQKERLEYAFSVSSPAFDSEITMTATEYDGTGLDWYHLDVAPHASLDTAKVAPESIHAHYLPKPVSFPGMPVDRFWEMEDGLIDLGTVDAGPTDIARMLATEYAVIYSPDWFVVPLELPVGSVTRIDWIIVTDTFGVETLIGTHLTQDEDEVGRMFQLSTTEDPLADQSFLLIPPAVLYGQQSAPLEDVLLERDEQANLAWIIEKSILGLAGRPVAVAPGKPEPLSVENLPEGETPPDLVYQVATWIPQGWVPLVTIDPSADGNGSLMLERGLLLEPDNVTLRDATSLLGLDIDRVYEEEVSRAGVRLQMVDQLARWTDGSTHLWRGRQKKAGRGESNAGLFFDFTGPPTD
ncbi:hypothetical protein PMI35_00387 [Pseudomonas sp. GM78]|uniref:hypothetical protein n=1 Tax=Pseudomonas sp. GM78 TaxID=1144337 RepID=UPI00026F482C|nr:hypothetical protein [Pseudomonas sp. GM78]EJN34820.1 hypothetical protein PMI35_00387 [Pseudomonas sp. GM78]